MIRRFLLTSCIAILGGTVASAQPNIVLVYADDLGYGDVSSYGATRIATPHIDRLAEEGLRFTNAHAAAATCTPSRYALLTGQYAWRRPGTGIARGDAPLVLPTDRPTLASILRDAGYTTGVVGKWHLGLGGPEGPDWNGDLQPGPLDVGFDYAFLIPATGDRVPTVYVENRRVVGRAAADSIRVSFSGPIGNEPTGREQPELLKMHPSHGHDQTIVNGISRIGHMAGGRSAWWVDETMSDVITERAVAFLERHRDERFFLFFSTHDIHVPRVVHSRYAHASALGPRGDAILQLDGALGVLLATLDRLGLADDTLVLFTSDNGPVLDDGYRDLAEELNGAHRPAGPWRGGKYSAFEGGTRVPFLVRWPARVEPGVSDALISQVDMPATLAALVGVDLTPDDAPDSFDLLPALLGETDEGRPHLVEQARTLALKRGPWKYIAPSDGPAVNTNTNIELANAPEPQLYNLDDDPGERRNLAAARPGLTAELAALLERIRTTGRDRVGDARRP